MANELIGRILEIKPTKEIQSKDGTKVWQKKEIILDCTKYDPYSGDKKYDNIISLEFFGDKCTEVNKFSPNQIVKIAYELRGRIYQDKQSGETRYYTSISPYNIEAHGTAARSQTPPPEFPTATDTTEVDVPF